MPALEEIRQRIPSALRSIVDPQGSLHGTPSMSPPRYEAFSVYIAGQRLFREGDCEGSLPMFRRAVTLDTAFTVAVGVAGVGTARCALTDSVLTLLEGRSAVPEAAAPDLLEALPEGAHPHDFLQFQLTRRWPPCALPHASGDRSLRRAEVRRPREPPPRPPQSLWLSSYSRWARSRSAPSF